MMATVFFGKCVGIPSGATKSVANDAAVVPESHLPAASAGERKRPSSRRADHAR